MVTASIGLCQACGEYHEISDVRSDHCELGILGILSGPVGIHREPLSEDLSPYALENERPNEMNS